MAVRAAAARPELDAVKKPVPLEDIALPEKQQWMRWPLGTAISLKDGRKGTFAGLDAQGSHAVHLDDAPAEQVRPKMVSRKAVRGSDEPKPHPLAGVCATGLRRPSPALAARLAAILDAAPPGHRPARAYIEALRDKGHPTYVVGGALRDAIRGLSDPTIEPRDVDLVGTALPSITRGVVEALEAEGGQAVISPRFVDNYGAVLLAGDRLDITALKAETAKGKLPRQTKALFGPDLSRDAALRDFTFNAIYYDAPNDVVIDPTGHGVRDAQSMTLRLIKSIEDADLSIPLRFTKFRMRGYAPAEGALEQIAAIADRTFDGGGLAAAVARVSPRSATTPASASTWLDDFGAAMKADGLGEAFDRWIAPQRSEVIAKILARNAP